MKRGADESADDAAADDETKVAFLSWAEEEVCDGGSIPTHQITGRHPASQRLHILNTTNPIGNRCWEGEARNGRGGGGGSEWKCVVKEKLKANKTTLTATVATDRKKLIFISTYFYDI